MTDKINIDSLPSNSHKSKKNTRLRPDNVPVNPPKKAKTKTVIRDTKKEPKAIAQGRVRKPSFLSKVASAFIGEDLGDIGGYLMWDILIPAGKKTLEEVINRGISMILYGDGGHSTSRRGRDDRTIVSYSSFFSRDRDRYGQIPDRDRRRTVGRSSHIRTSKMQDRLDAISFVDGGEASDILMNLEAFIEQYGCVSVADYLELADLSDYIQYTDNGWGWYDLSRAVVRTTRYGNYEIDFPAPIELED